jgi:hypothetical protein
MTESSGLITITVLERLPDGGGWLFAYRAEGANFQYANALLKAHISSGMRQWLPDEKCWWFSSLGMIQLARMFTDVRMALDELAREEARTGTGTDANAGTSAGGAGAPLAHGAPADICQAFAVLHLLPSAPLPVIKAAFRALATLYHPDHGGSHDAMLRINAAYTVACRWTERTTTTPGSANGQTAGHRKAGRAG